MSKKKSNNTIFDDVFRTMLEKMPQLIVPVINEVFHTSYPEDVKIEQHRNEHHTKEGEIITDSCLEIQDKLYHIECQSNPDSTMVIRMIEYDFSIALENASKDNGYEMEFPNSCVLYLRHTKTTPDSISMKVKVSDKVSFLYKVPVVKVQEYTKDDIFQKGLLFFLPFYIMRYEKQIPEMKENSEELKELLKEYQGIQKELDKGLTQNEKSVMYLNLINLIIRISDYLAANNDSVKKGIGDVMGGKVLELESEKLLKTGMETGIKTGMKTGMKKGQITTLKELINDGILTVQEAAKRAGMTEEEFELYEEEKVTL